jgi:hypothetical protein
MKRLMMAVCMLCGLVAASNSGLGGKSVIGSVGGGVAHADAGPPASCLALNNSTDKQFVGKFDVPTVLFIAQLLGVPPGAIFAGIAQRGYFELAPGIYIFVTECPPPA